MTDKDRGYIVTEMKKDVVLAWGGGVPRGENVPGRIRMMEHVLWLDQDIGPGNFYSECLWFYPPSMIHPEELAKMEQFRKSRKPTDPPVGPQPHVHPFDEVFAFFGSNYDDPKDLCGEIEFWLEDEAFVFDQSCIVYIPAGLKHCPLVTRKIDKPIFHFSLGVSPTYQHKLLSGPGKYAGTDCSKYFVYDDKPDLMLPGYRHEPPREVATRVAYLDGEVLPGANLNSEALWFWPREKTVPKPGGGNGVEAHTHPFTELIGFFGTDENNISDLCGEVELYIDGKRHVVNKSFLAVIPAGIEHGPLNITRIEKPVFAFTVGHASMYE